MFKAIIAAALTVQTVTANESTNKLGNSTVVTDMNPKSL